MSIEFKGDIECFTTDNIVAADGSSQSRCLWWKYADGQNVQHDFASIRARRCKG